MSGLSLVYLLLTLGGATVLILWLRRPGSVRAEMVWALAAILPLFAALVVALGR